MNTIFTRTFNSKILIQTLSIGLLMTSPLSHASAEDVTLANVATTQRASHTQSIDVQTSNTQITTYNQQDIDAVKQLMYQYQQILNKAQASKVKDVYAKDAMFIGQNFPTTVGVTNIKNLYTDFLSKLDFNVNFEIKEIQLDQNIGFVRTKSTGSITPKGEQTLGRESNREIFVVKKTDGNWKIYRYMFTAELK